MEEYFKAKAKLFKLCKTGVINIDDEWVRKVYGYADCKIVTYGIESPADYKAENIELFHNKVTFTVKIKGSEYGFTAPIPALFTVYNLLACIAACAELGISPEVMQTAVLSLAGVPGRFENVENGRGISIIVDYAHTPDSLANIIRAVKGFTKGKVITLFGCGGDRDVGKRPIMGEIAGELSDYVILSNDNPRNEEPAAIIRQIAVGVKMTSCPFAEIVDRTEAIRAALGMAEAGDSVIIAGKGHETYMEFEGRRRVAYNDIEAVRGILGEGNSG
jgi:UDP-N-acetylmuramoyl-L-alanyl-D-glutamate--2,6-diaminopimelate ligase